MLKSITNYIPQRSPIIMVDELLSVNEETAQCCLTIKEDNFFIESDGMLAEPGLIEHIAQSASAMAGYLSLSKGAEKAPVGYIGEIKNFHLYQRPKLGDVVITTITMGAEVEGITIIRGESKVNDEVYADTTMKIFIKD